MLVCHHSIPFSCVFSGVISCSFRAFLCSRVLPLVVAFYFVLFSYVLFAVRVRSAPGAHTFSVVPGTSFSSVAHVKFWLRERALQGFIIYGPAPFSLRKPALEKEC